MAEHERALSENEHSLLVAIAARPNGAIVRSGHSKDLVAALAERGLVSANYLDLEGGFFTKITDAGKAALP